MMSNPGFVERELIRGRLPRLSPRQRAAFAAGCAERVLPLALHFFGRPWPCRDAVDLAWRFASGEEPSETEVGALTDACEALIGELYDDDETGYPMYALKSSASAVAAVASAHWEAAEEAAFDAQDAANGADVDRGDEHVQEEATWQVQALDVALATKAPERTMFNQLPSNPRWLQAFVKRNPGKP